MKFKVYPIDNHMSPWVVDTDNAYVVLDNAGRARGACDRQSIFFKEEIQFMPNWEAQSLERFIIKGGQNPVEDWRGWVQWWANLPWYC